MTIERYLIIKNPLISIDFKKRPVIISIIFAWIYSAVWMIPQFFSKNGFVLEGFQTHCSFDYFTRDLYSRSFMMIMFTGGLVLPLLLIIFLYSNIWFMLISNKMFMDHLVTDRTKSSIASSRITSKRNTKHSFHIELNHLKTEDSHLIERKSVLSMLFKKDANQRIINKQVKLLKAIIVIILMFCIAWFPYAIVTLLAQFGTNIQRYITPYTTAIPSLFAKLSSVYNPLIFILTNKKLKKFYKKKQKVESSDIS